MQLPLRILITITTYSEPFKNLQQLNVQKILPIYIIHFSNWVKPCKFTQFQVVIQIMNDLKDRCNPTLNLYYLTTGISYDYRIIKINKIKIIIDSVVVSIGHNSLIRLTIFDFKFPNDRDCFKWYIIHGHLVLTFVTQKTLLIV